MLELQEALSNVDANYKNLEATVSALNVPAGLLNLGNTALLNYETDPERQSTYNELVNKYQWFEKTHLYSALANTMLSHNSMKRSYYTSSTKRRRPLTSQQTSNQSLAVDQMINSINSNNMTIKIYRPFATCTSAFLHVSSSMRESVDPS